ncbi:MAG TPA: methylated-DNA--[protein]-cysteine S-methyltransferase [Nitrospirae bacterium]|nr:methylated-DNA--[protein]-cysteine S-methyltransferase [Nitrospirota bacterium]
MNRRKPPCSELLYDLIQTPLGHICLTYSITTKGALRLSGVGFGAPAHAAKRNPLPAWVEAQFREYFEGRRRRFDIQIALSGTEFDKKVWLALNEIPYGETRTYKWLAERLGIPRGVRAVGRALGRNPLPIVLPCHRVIQSDGGLGGYSSGIEIKRRLLDLEYYSSLGSGRLRESRG